MENRRRSSILDLQSPICEMKAHSLLRSTLKLARLLLLLFLAHSAGAQTDRPGETRRTETLAPGIEHLEIRRGDFDSEAERDRWLIQALILDPQSARLTLARAMDEVVGAETTSSLAARHGALAAINAGYFRTTGTYRGEPVGVLATRGKLLSEPVERRSALAISTAGGRLRVAIARIDFKAEVKVARRLSHSVHGFNRPREANELIVFTPEFHRTTLTAPDGIEVLVARGRVIAVRDGAGSQRIPPGGFVLSASGTVRAWMRANLRRGMRVEIRSEVIASPPLPFTADFIIGGGPQLVRAGAAIAAAEAEHFNEDFSRRRHPRTAVGMRDDGKLVLVTVDGRQPRKSVGLTLEELAQLMIELGCREALNLDGGGSTTLVIRNRVVNSPSDQSGERPVSDALLIYPQAGRKPEP
jgi:hypothetical protein